jgi:TrmH family RNA methyltransferase
MPAVILENIRSAYNVGNIIRTADAFWFEVIISWYTPNPLEDPSVCKTSLWAEKSVPIYSFWNPKEAIEFAKSKYRLVVASEIRVWWKDIRKFDFDWDIAIVFWNEKTWILRQTLELVDDIVFIPMIWKKESLNVWQSAAIFMWEVFKKLNY